MIGEVEYHEMEPEEAVVVLPHEGDVLDVGLLGEEVMVEVPVEAVEVEEGVAREVVLGGVVVDVLVGVWTGNGR